MAGRGDDIAGEGVEGGYESVRVNNGELRARPPLISPPVEARSLVVKATVDARDLLRSSSRSGICSVTFEVTTPQRTSRRPRRGDRGRSGLAVAFHAGVAELSNGGMLDSIQVRYRFISLRQVVRMPLFG